MSKLKSITKGCVSSGNCCRAHWRLSLIDEREIALFDEDKITFNGKVATVWTDECKYFINGGCSIYDTKPKMCSDFYCGGTRMLNYPTKEEQSTKEKNRNNRNIEKIQHKINNTSDPIEIERLNILLELHLNEKLKINNTH